jgi:hypothetical protein
MATPVDDTRARLDRILQRYGSDADVVWLVEAVEPRHSCIQRRDGAVRAAREHFAGTMTTAARALADALSAYFVSGWPGEQHLSALPDAAPRHQALHAILRLNGGRPLAYRRIMDIFK